MADLMRDTAGRMIDDTRMTMDEALGQCLNSCGIEVNEDEFAQILSEFREVDRYMRIKSPGDDQELGIEIVQFYLGGNLGGVISPATFDEPCPFMEKYQELKNSKDEDDKELAKTLVPRRRYVIGGPVYADEKGTKFDYEGKDKGVLVPRSVYQDIIDLYLDEDEAGDMTDPRNGYDIKIIRSGSGKLDTTYSARACKPTKLDKKYQGNVDLEGIVRSQIKSYDELEELLAKFLNEDHGGDDEDDKPKKKTKKKGIHRDHYMEDDEPKKKKKKRYKSDI
jgi:hypothetical protein